MISFQPRAPAGWLPPLRELPPGIGVLFALYSRPILVVARPLQTDGRLPGPDNSRQLRARTFPEDRSVHWQAEFSAQNSAEKSLTVVRAQNRAQVRAPVPRYPSAPHQRAGASRLPASVLLREASFEILQGATRVPTARFPAERHRGKPVGTAALVSGQQLP